MKKITVKFFIYVFLLSLPAASSAFTYKYYKPIDGAENNLLISWGSFGSLENYNCDLNNYSCLKTKQKSFPENADILISAEEEWYNPEKNLAVYKISEKTSSEKITRYFISLYAQNKWSSGRQLFIVDDMQKIYWPKNNPDEFAYIVKSNDNGIRDFVRFNFTGNREMTRKTVSGAVTNGTISPDGLWLAFYAPLKNGKKSTVLLNLTSPAKEYKFEYSVPKNLELLTDANRLIAFSANSLYFAFLEDGNNFPVARIVNLENGEPQFLNSAEVIGKNIIGTAADVWFPKNDTLLILGNDKTRALDWNLYSYDIPTKQLTVVVSDASYMHEMRQAGKQVLLGRMDGPNLTPILYDPNTKQYHEFNLEKSLADPALSREIILLKNNLNGVVVKNKNAKITEKTPLIIWLHGGPYRQIAKVYHSYPSYAAYDWILDQLALQGAVVLKTDYRGSYGYGNDAAYGVINNVGKQDVLDVYDAAKFIKKKLNLKGETYLMGNSYGGYLAPKTLTAYPQEFNGAIAINGVFEWRTLLNYLKSSLFNAHFNGLYNPNKTEMYSQASITNKIKNLSPKQKIIIIHGMADNTINTDQSYAFYELLKNAGKSAKIISIPDEDHIFLKPSSIETICKASAEAIGLKIKEKACVFK